MNEDDCKLIIEINYDSKKFSIENDNEVELNEIISQSIKNFNIENDLQKYIVLTYIDEEGDINIINNKEDIINSSIEISSQKYLSKIFLDIADINEDKNLSNKKNLENLIENKIIEENKEIQKLEEMNNFKDNKIIELEGKIIKLEQDYQNLVNTKHNNLINIFKKEKKLEKNHQNSENDFMKNEIKSLINDLLKSERDNLENKLKKFKEDLILDIHTNLKKDKYDETLNNILKDLSFIKENITVDKKEKKIEDNNNINLDYNKLLLNNMAMMKPSKIYRCQNCNNCFIFNECFNISNKKSFDSHNFKLENLDKNNKEKDKIVENINRINNNDKNEIIEEIPKIVNKKNKNKFDVNNNIEQNDENNKNEENQIQEGDDDFKEDLELQNIFRKYFFKDKGELRKDPPTLNELNEIKKYYKIYYANGIQEYQQNFIIEVDKEIAKLSKRNNANLILKVKERKQKIEELLQTFINETKEEERKKRRNNNFNRGGFYYKGQKY